MTYIINLLAALICKWYPSEQQELPYSDWIAKRGAIPKAGKKLRNRNRYS